MTSAELPEKTGDAQPSAPNGAAWAAIVAAAVGCISFGILADLTEVSKPFKGWCNIYNPSGDLSGKSTGAVIVWVLVWVVLHIRWKGTSVKHTGLIGAFAVVLILASLAATFPPMFELISGK